MQEPSFSRKVAAGYFVSLAGLFWMLSLPYKPHGIVAFFGSLAALMCAAGSLVFFCGASFAYMVWRRKWSPRSCKWAGLLFAVPGAFFILTSGRMFPTVGILIGLITLTGYVCQRFAFPELTDEQASAPALPPSLFPK